MSEKLSLITPRTPPGVMELLPREQIAFQRFMDTIRRGYERFGFLPIETPVFELSEVLLTKDGGETEKQVYFVQSTGALAQGHKPELALHFDLTVPLARYVAEHEHKLNFPFRRYQMQKVYRGERAQKGRSREFYQCDIDVIGKDELALGYDAELPAIIYGIFKELQVGDFVINLNNRKLAFGLLEGFGLVTREQQMAALHEIDRLDKIGREDVLQRLTGAEVGLAAEVATRLLDVLSAKASNAETLEALLALGFNNAGFVQGFAELKAVFVAAMALGVPEHVLHLNLSIVRGLDYYTGTVYETVLLKNPELGSVCSGGRYENLAGHYTKSKLPGVGISIGATRLFGQLLEAGIIKAEEESIAKVLVTQLETAMLGDYFSIGAELRAAGINTEVYVDEHKLGKQLKYADRAGIPFAVVVGPEEKAKGTVLLKHLKTATQEELPRTELVARLRELVG